MLQGRIIRHQQLLLLLLLLMLLVLQLQLLSRTGTQDSCKGVSVSVSGAEWPPLARHGRRFGC